MMTQETLQALRNKIYAVVASLGTILVTLGTTDIVTVEEGTQLLDQILTLSGSGLLLYGTIMAFIKSLPSRVTTIDLPNEMVKEILTSAGEVIAGPASPVVTGTVLTFDIGESSLDDSGE